MDPLPVRKHRVGLRWASNQPGQLVYAHQYMNAGALPSFACAGRLPEVVGLLVLLPGRDACSKALTVNRQGYGRSKAHPRRPSTISEQEFQTFLNALSDARSPRADPGGFRDRLICLKLKEGGFRLGELLGMRLSDLDFGKRGVHVRFRTNNENAARAKAGYGRDRFVHLPPPLLGLLDLYLTFVERRDATYVRRQEEEAH